VRFLNPPPRVSVVIKTYDDRETHQRAPAERQREPVLIRYLSETLEALVSQTLQPLEVLVVDSSRGEGIALALESRQLSRALPIRRISISSEQFTHPRALNLGIQEAAGEVVSILSGDATPANERWLEALVIPLADPYVAGTYSRQIYRPGVAQSTAEKFRLWWRYRRQSSFKRRDPLFSNASAAFRRSLALETPFDEGLKELEDYDWAMKVRERGLTIVYAGDSEVYHSHSSTSWQTLWRMIYYGYFRAKLHALRIIRRTVSHS
jgi:GT2 family glycosyltransferase